MVNMSLGIVICIVRFSTLFPSVVFVYNSEGFPVTFAFNIRRSIRPSVQSKTYTTQSQSASALFGFPFFFFFINESEIVSSLFDFVFNIGGNFFVALHLETGSSLIASVWRWWWWWPVGVVAVFPFLCVFFFC